MKHWERDLVQALGRVEGARDGLTGVGGYLLLDGAHEALKVAIRALDEAAALIRTEIQRHETPEEKPPWSTR